MRLNETAVALRFDDPDSSDTPIIYHPKEQRTGSRALCENGKKADEREEL